MSIRMDDPVFTMLAALVAALAVSLVERGFRCGCRVGRRAKRRITQIERVRPVTLEFSLRLKVQLVPARSARGYRRSSVRRASRARRP